MNVAEILRMAGYEIRRAPSLDWQEQLIGVLAKAMVESPKDEEALVQEAIALGREKTQNDLHIRWMLRDALDRAALLRAQSNPFAMYGGTV